MNVFKIIGLLILIAASPATASAANVVSMRDLQHTIVTSSDVTMIPEIENAKALDKREMMCLALNIYHEARGSSSTDQWSVGFVTMNRWETKERGDTICDVVLENSRFGRRVVPQFSWATMKMKRLVPHEVESWDRAQRIAYSLYVDYEDLYDFTEGATNFYAYRLGHKPEWARLGYDFKRIGAHVYLKLADHTGS